MQAARTIAFTQIEQGREYTWPQAVRENARGWVAFSNGRYGLTLTDTELVDAFTLGAIGGRWLN